MKHITQYFLSMITVLAFICILNIGILAGVCYKTNNGDTYVQVKKYSEKLVKDEDIYFMDPETEKIISERNGFAMLIGEDGNVRWSYRKPEEIPDTYKLADVASFSRWYLCEYPVYSWTRDDGVFVVGLPKDSVWKYSLEYSLLTVKSIISLIPYILIIDILLLIIIPLWSSRRWVAMKERQRAEWIAGVSHDIRTPLSIVLGQAEPGSVTERQCLRMKELIQNLNMENKLDSGTGSWENESVNLAALIRECICDSINSNEEIYNFELEIEPELESYEIHGDESLIRRMVENLINNSIRHNESGCDIHVSLKKKDKKVSLKICDNGKGADSLVIKKLNQKIKKEYIPEHGLGLRVVKQISRKYNYKVVFSSNKGNGFENEVLFSFVRIVE